MKMSEEIVYSAVTIKSNAGEPKNTGTEEQRREHTGDVEYAAVTFRRIETHNQEIHPKGRHRYIRLAVGTLFILLLCVAIILYVIFTGYVGQCPEDWESINRTCYYFSHDQFNWTASRDKCVSVGGHLVIIDSREEQIYIMHKLKNKTDEFWIGLTDAENEGCWRWVDNTDVTLKFWHQGQPNNSSGLNNTYVFGEDCGIMRDVSQHELNWFDQNCGSVYNRICELQIK